MFALFANACLIAFGIILIGFAPHMSNYEKRLMDKRPSTRVTGWSGTWKGILAWRLIGIALVAMGLFELVFNRSTN